MRISTLDIGTNTVLGLDATAAGGRVERTADHLDIVRLGEGLDRSGRLSEAAMERALAVLGRHGARLRDERPDVARAVATEAVRKAENADEFLGRAARALGFAVEVIGGEREAQLSWLATVRSIAPPATAGAPRTVLEIGGGSTQLMRGPAAASAPTQAVSLPIGSVRLRERLVHSDPPGAEEQRALRATIDAALDGAPGWGRAASGAGAGGADPAAVRGDLVGIAGTITTVCAIHLGMVDYDADLVHGRRLDGDAVRAVVERLAGMTQAERLRLPGLDARRADVIFAGAVILERVLLRGGFAALIVSDRGIRWGLAYEIAAAGAADGDGRAGPT